MPTHLDFQRVIPKKIKQTVSTLSTFSLAAVASICLTILCACQKNDTAVIAPPQESKQPAPALKPMSVSSPDFANGETIAKKFTADGANLSPAISWSAPSDKTASFALITNDPDAPDGDWIHWVVYDIPASERGLTANISKEAVVAGQAKQGRNSFRKTGYGGPQPPPGKLHHYYFTVYALDTRIEAKGLDAKGLMKSMQGHILNTGKLMGTYQR